jgi:hypothetical protein
MIWKAFLTGSRAYGTPRVNSDVDVVVRTTPELIDTINLFAFPETTFDWYENDSVSFKFGNLNLICVKSDVVYEAWKTGTDELTNKSPVSREDAITAFEALGIKPFSGDSFGDTTKKKITTSDNEIPF